MSTFARYGILFSIYSFVAACSFAAAAADDFNSYIVKSTEKLVRERSGRGFAGDANLSSAYSQDLEYVDLTSDNGDKGVIKYKEFPPRPSNAKRPKTNETICVAAVTEAIVEALNLYYHDAGANENQQARKQSLMKLPPRKWSRMPLQRSPKGGDISGYLFTVTWCNCDGRREFLDRGWGQCASPSARDKDYKEKMAVWDKSSVQLARNSGEALEKFGIGEVIRVDSRNIDKLDLKNGDLINHNRLNCAGSVKNDKNCRKDGQRLKWGGHAVIFLGWIEKSGKRIGYKYFSAQAYTNGFGYMNGYFKVNDHTAKQCPDGLAGGKFGGKLDDCGIERNFDAGRMWHPRDWTIDKKLVDLKSWLRLKRLYACEGNRTYLAPEFDDGDRGNPEEAETPTFQNLAVDGR